MSFKNWDESKKKVYVSLLTNMASISKLFSISAVPFIDYRSHEKIFCMSFNATDRGRDDSSVDATIGTMGVGLKTFREGNGKTVQKIAEFNSITSDLSALRAVDLVQKLAEFRNLRINATKKRYGLTDCIYHCIVRKEKKIAIHEFVMREIEEVKQDSIKESKNIVTFSDKYNYYSYNRSKSTLYMRFNCIQPLSEFKIKILSNPYSIFQLSTAVIDISHEKLKKAGVDFIYLPLYSTQNKNYGNPMPSSGLNLWNADGRPRDPNEIYIPVPNTIFKLCPTFFVRDVKKKFGLYLPNGTKLTASLCQQGGKGLMSNPNKALGYWILREIFNLKKGKLVTRNILDKIGIDAVCVEKFKDGYRIDFAKTGSYEEFIEKLG